MSNSSLANDRPSYDGDCMAHVPASKPYNHSPYNRVCDRCMKKKIKCTLQRPACSRCIEENSPCVYSSARKKPGPVKGRHRKSASAPLKPNEPTTGISASSITPSEDVPPLSGLSQTRSLTSTALANSVRPAEINSSCLSSTTHRNLTDLQLQPGQERQLLEYFFTYVEPSVNLFQRAAFFQRYEEGLVAHDLLVTILAVCAKLQSSSTDCSGTALESCLHDLLTGQELGDEKDPGILLLDDFRKACLLAFYEFHQYQGRKSWVRISHLTRKAYQYGLHQIDNEEHCPLRDGNAVADKDLEEWRQVWWCIYRLDSYCNITAATPFVVEVNSLRTALLGTSRFENMLSPDASAIFLPPEADLLWKTIKEIIFRGGETNFNIHLVTITMLKEAATVSRLWKQNPSKGLWSRSAALEDYLAAIRLALPRDYLNMTRNVFANESSFAHHSRLTCILHLYASSLLMSCLPLCKRAEGPEWRCQWQRTLENCEDMISVAKQWNPQYCISVDPAICFIILSALTIIHLHSIDELNIAVELQARLASHKSVLVLFLEQFASIWYLPQFLLKLFDRFVAFVPGPVSSTDISRILNQAQGPLYPAWLKLLSLVPDRPKSPWEENIDFGLYSKWHYSDWDPILDVFMD